jgi:hypothetical protein
MYRLYEFTTVTSPDGKQVELVSGRVSDQSNPTGQKEWITFQLAVDMPTNLNGALQREAALGRARDILHQLSSDFDKTGHQRVQNMPNQDR